ncbi:aminopeptidase N [Desulfuromonas carbonis]|uniref:aminopeptidase N n=1 Tax=Desulfuromonas sp. DDH964 TaxID=1823759 RepID=UPI00078BE82D|nr:aminopeptidase N [Desulfuromonas sp. DDH964]AMV70899.1 aminopeptidase N [Desulfuromonas sp. DDH964]
MTTPTTIFRHDYTPPPFLVDAVDLRFDLDPERTIVRSRLQLRRNPAVTGTPALVLYGQELELVELALDGAPLAERQIRVDAEQLAIAEVPAAFELTVTTAIAPAANTALEGLYVSSGNFCTQCEPEGFRRITYYPDRPDVMAKFTTTVAGDRKRYPVLLSNGNPVAQGELPEGRHFVTWEDPFPKPSYLFALVAGQLVCIEDQFVTASGRKVALRFYVEERNRAKCAHAVASLQRAMAWDEETFGLEYDLDIYMVVAVDDFNMGAMENKGLNVFNSKYVLALPESATDLDYQGIEGVIGHEYFHNWTGNRVTCRDWFQLSLKEGLTVFRDQEFSAAMTSAAVKRIQDVRLLRNAQFPEDAGPMAHPVRPDSYEEINNFYTMTVYNKGAEVIRMQHTLLGAAGFRRGLDLYFERHDGAAVTVDDFVAAMADGGGIDLDQFRRWYSQAGTPVVAATGSYDAAARSYTLTLRQSCPPTPGQPVKEPFHIPLAVGLLGPDGADLPLRLEGEARAAGTTRVLELRAAEQSFRFLDLPAAPVPSLLRSFSAPVRLDINLDDTELAFLFAHDSDSFNRWEAGQQLAVKLLLDLVAAVQAGRELALPEHFRAAFRAALTDSAADPALLAQALLLPAESYLAEQMEVADPIAIHAAREFVRHTLGSGLQKELQTVYMTHQVPGPYRPEPAAVGRRSLRNLSLAYLAASGHPRSLALAERHYRQADNMTDAMAGLAVLANVDIPERVAALDDFYQRWQDDPLVVDKWLTLQATSSLPGTLSEVERLLGHSAFTMKNPNKVRALIGAFAHGNPVRFHVADGSGYRFVAERILELDPRNPQVAARLAGAFGRWRRFDPNRQQLMQEALQQILAAPQLSRDVREVVSKTLG